MRELKIAITVAIVIIALTIKMAFGADAITELFMRYNPRQAETLAQIVREAGKAYNVDPNIIAAIIVHESSVRPNVVSRGGDYGLMQVRWIFHKDKVSKASDLLEPRTNVLVGTRIFAEYYAQKKTIRGALLRYSGGNRALADKVMRTASGLGE